MRPFRLHEPSTIEEAVAVLSQLGDSARLYAGGTELLLAMRSGFLTYDHLVNIKTVNALDDIVYDDAAGEVTIGATATHSAVEGSRLVREHLPMLASVEHRVANVRVRNVGTLGGNLCFAEPHSDPAVALLVYEAEAHITGASGTRVVPVERFHTGPYETAVAPDEVLASVRIRPLPEDVNGVYLKFGYHHRPTLGVAAAVRVSDGVVTEARIAIGSASPVPTRLREAEGPVVGERVEDVAGGQSAAVAEAGRLASQAVEAVDDLHGSAEYKVHLVRVFVARALMAAAGRDA